MTLFCQYSDYPVPTLPQKPTKWACLLYSPPTETYKMTMPLIFSHSHILNCLKMPYLQQSPTSFHFYVLKIVFISISLGQKVERLLFVILDASQWSVPLFTRVQCCIQKKYGPVSPAQRIQVRALVGSKGAKSP